MRESGYYPDGTEFDPRAPWNERDEEFVCEECGEIAEHDGEYHCDVCGHIGEAVSLDQKRQEEYEDAMERRAEERREEGW